MRNPETGYVILNMEKPNWRVKIEANLLEHETELFTNFLQPNRDIFLTLRKTFLGSIRMWYATNPTYPNCKLVIQKKWNHEPNRDKISVVKFDKLR